MKDEAKSREQLMAELEELRAELAQLRAEQGGGAEDPEVPSRHALMQNMEMFRALFEQASDSIFLMEMVKGVGPVIIDANRAACRTHGYEKHELVGMPISMLDSPETARHVPSRAERLISGKRIFFEGAHRRKDGSEFPVEVSAQMVEVGGKSYIVGADRDISQHKEAERRLRFKAQKLRESNQKLQGFVYLASHELHAPLISLVRTLDLLMQRAGHALGSEGKEYLETAQMSAEGMLASVRELISVSKHSDSQTPPPEKPHALEEQEKRL